MLKKIFISFVLLLMAFSVMSSTDRYKKTDKRTRGKAPIERFSYTTNEIVVIQNTYKVEGYYKSNNTLTLYLAESLSDIPFNDSIVSDVYDSLRFQLPERYKDYELKIVSKFHYIHEYIPNFKRNESDIDKNRYPKRKTAKQVVTKVSKAYSSNLVLSDRNITLLNSHGLFYNKSKEQWVWQRPCLFGTVEDLLTFPFTTQYLLPMLENAGAQIYMPRERDVNSERISLYKQAVGDSLVFTGQLDKAMNAWIKIKYPKKYNACNKVLCSVYHSGVRTDYQIDQSFGQTAWHYLDNLYFDGDVKVVFKSLSKNHNFDVSDVVIGGGMGDERNDYPAFAEGSLYYLKDWSMPDSIMYDQKEGYVSDYFDDIYSRAKWVKHLTGGSEVFAKYPGLRIPIDASIAIHTDAGIAPADSTIGTLVICTSDNEFPSKYSQLASNDLAEYMREQIVGDIRAKYNDKWATRGIWHRQYVESRIPPVPSVLLEVLSHQNFNDMKLALDPKFQFDVSRSIYKGLLKYFSEIYDIPYVVQPLPVNSFYAEFDKDENVILNWKPTVDKLESTANATKYILYTRINDNSFDNGQIVSTNSIKLELLKDSIYSFKVTALNYGGESFDSEILSVCSASDSKGEALIINGFDRIDAPISFSNEQVGGFMYDYDFGVPYKYNVTYIGKQFEYDKSKEYYSDDYPGFGASENNMGMQVIAGNTFDYAFVHGKALLANSYSFVSSSKQAVMNSDLNLKQYDLIDLILGQQCTNDEYQLMPDQLKFELFNYIKNRRKKLIISGAYVGDDNSEFAVKALRYKIASSWASKTGLLSDKYNKLSFNLQMQPNSEQYFLQNLHSINKTNYTGDILLYYPEKNLPAVVAYKKRYKTVVAGFPIEALTSQKQINDLMTLFINYLD